MQPTQPTVTAQTVTPAAILRDAATYLADNGWWPSEGLYADLRLLLPRASVEGAIRYAVRGVADDLDPYDMPFAQSWPIEQACDELALFLGEHGHLLAYDEDSDMSGLGSLDYFNTSDGRTSGQVQAVLRHAADACQIRDLGGSWPPATALVSRTLREAAFYLFCNGWVQGCYYEAGRSTVTPPACLVGAIGIVCYGELVDAPALNYEAPGFGDYLAAVDFLDEYLSGQSGPVVCAYEFNDAKGREEAQVVDLLARAADAWDRLTLGQTLARLGGAR